MSETPNELVADFLEARTRRDRAQAEFEEAQARLIKQMEADQRKTFKWTADGRNHNLTFVQQHTTVIDEPGLRKALTAKIFDRYTKRVLVRQAMERAMDEGKIDPITVSRFVTQRPKKPFINYTEKDTE
jgi:phosphoenolpyruvate-protein kinase (PTS system EI component)